MPKVTEKKGLYVTTGEAAQIAGEGWSEDQMLSLCKAHNPIPHIKNGRKHFIERAAIKPYLRSIQAGRKMVYEEEEIARKAVELVAAALKKVGASSN